MRPIGLRSGLRTGQRAPPRLLAVLLIMLSWTGWACAHAPPATGTRGLAAGPDPDYPEINCAVNNTVDCRPGSY